jgi:hypothetical protein
MKNEYFVLQSADVINAFLTGCKENKKLLSQDKFFDAYPFM